MPVFTVHQPPPQKPRSADPERLVFVRDGFHVWAFLLGPLWMIWHRLWIVLVLYGATLVALSIVLVFARAGGSASWTLVFLLALLIGLEASSLRRWTLALRGWRDVGIVVGPDLESAERLFLSSWIEAAPAHSAASAAPAKLPPRAAPSSPPDVIGLFPKPGVRP